MSPFEVSKERTAAEATPLPPADSAEGTMFTRQNDANFQRGIENRQMVFLSLAGSIGAGLFVASGSALSSGGGGNAVLNYAVVGFMICTTMGSLGELASKDLPSCLV